MRGRQTSPGGAGGGGAVSDCGEYELSRQQTSLSALPVDSIPAASLVGTPQIPDVPFSGLRHIGMSHCGTWLLLLTLIGCDQPSLRGRQP